MDPLCGESTFLLCFFDFFSTIVHARVSRPIVPPRIGNMAAFSTHNAYGVCERHVVKTRGFRHFDPLVGFGERSSTAVDLLCFCVVVSETRGGRGLLTGRRWKKLEISENYAII